jgi:predicted AAA+ superfamily ATPase
MDKTVVIPLIYEWQNIVMRRQGVKRELEEPLYRSIGSRPIKIVTGFRRSGKSFLVQQVARRYVDEEEILPENLLYLNLEDFRLMAVTTPQRLNDIFELFLSTSAKPGKKLLIFDEIQNVADWDRFIRTLYEKESDDIEILLTGSNSELLSSELGSNLAGRFIEFRLFPFSLQEFLVFKGIPITTTAEYHRNRRELQALFNEFLKFGGLPEIFTIVDGDAKLSYLSGILSKVILDDVVRRFRVDNVTLLEKILNYLLASAGSITTFASLTRQAKALGFRTKSETVIAYCGYFVKALALFELNRFSWKQGRIFSDTRKYFSIDTGLITLFRPAEENQAARLEHTVCLELLRRHGTVHFGTNDNGRELDFLVPRDGRLHDKYQVTATLTADDEKRELGAFALADPYLREGKNILLSLDEDETMKTYQGVTIECVNLLRWLLRV